jgi:uncharacterized protein YoxC
MANKNIAVTVILRANNFMSRVINGARGSMLGLRNSIFSTRSAIEAFAAGMVIHGIKELFDLGSQAEETANKFDTVFGSMSGDVDAFLKTMGRLGGLTEEQGQAMVATTGQIAQGLGISQEASAGFSKQVLQTAIDMGSFNNAPTKDVLDAINSGLTGIIVPLKQYGIVLRAADIDQKAMSMSGKKSAETLTQAEKATAALALIQSKAGVAMGDMARTADSTANTARRLGAELGDVRENIGKIVVASFKAAGGFGTTEESIKSFNDWLEKNRDQIAAWGGFTIKIIQLVISAVKNLVKVAFNSGEIIGNFLTGIWNITTTDLTKPGALEAIKNFWNDANKDIQGNFDDIKDAANDTADALNEVALAGQTAAAVSRGEFKFGSGPKTMVPKITHSAEDDESAKAFKKNVEDVTKSTAALQKQFDLGIISAEEFRRKAAGLSTQLINLRDSGSASADQIADLGQALSDLNKALALLPSNDIQKQIDVVTKAFTSGRVSTSDYIEVLGKFADTQQKAFSAGLITGEEFRHNAIAIGTALTDLQDNSRLTGEQLAGVGTALQDLNAAASAAPKQNVVTALGKQADLAVQQFHLGLITMSQFVDQWEKIRPALVTLRDSGTLTSDQLIAVQQTLKDINSVAEEIASKPIELVKPEQVGLIADIGRELQSMFSDAENFSKLMAEVGSQFLKDFGSAIENATAAWVSGSKSAGEAFKEGMLNAIAAVARAEGEFFLAKALGAIGDAFLDPVAAGPNLAAAAKFIAAATAMFALAGGISGLGSAGGGGGGGGTDNANVQSSRLSDQRGLATLVVESPDGYLNMNDPITEDSLARALESLSGRRVVIRKSRK